MGEDYSADTGITRAVSQYVPPTGPIDVDEPRAWQRLPQLVFGVAAVVALVAFGGVAIALTSATGDSTPHPYPHAEDGACDRDAAVVERGAAAAATACHRGAAEHRDRDERSAAATAAGDRHRGADGDDHQDHAADDHHDDDHYDDVTDHDDADDHHHDYDHHHHDADDDDELHHGAVRAGADPDSGAGHPDTAVSAAAGVSADSAVPAAAPVPLLGGLCVDGSAAIDWRCRPDGTHRT